MVDLYDHPRTSVIMRGPNPNTRFIFAMAFATIVMVTAMIMYGAFDDQALRGR